MTPLLGQGQPPVVTAPPHRRPSQTLATWGPGQAEVVAEAQIYKLRTKESPVLAGRR